MISTKNRRIIVRKYMDKESLISDNTTGLSLNIIKNRWQVNKDRKKREINRKRRKRKIARKRKKTKRKN